MPEASLGSELRALRGARGLSLATLAAGTGLPRSTISAWETGRNHPSGPDLDRLLSRLQTDPRDRARLLQAHDPLHAQAALAETVLGPPVDLGQVLRAMRLRRKMGQADVGRSAGLSQSAVARYEANDRLAQGETLDRLLDAVGADVRERAFLRKAHHSTEAVGGDVIPIDRDHLANRFTSSDVPLLLQEMGLWHAALRNREADRLLIHTMGYRAAWLATVDRFPEARTLAQRTLRLAQTLDLLNEATAAVEALGIVDLHCGRRDRMVARFTAWLERPLPTAHRAWVLCSLPGNLGELGQESLGMRYAKEFTELCECEKDALIDFSTITGLSVESEVLLASGDYEAAYERLSLIPPDAECYPHDSHFLEHLRIAIPCAAGELPCDEHLMDLAKLRTHQRGFDFATLLHRAREAEYRAVQRRKGIKDPLTMADWDARHAATVPSPLPSPPAR